MAVKLEYAIGDDATAAWLPVPLVFPWHTFASAEDWAREVAENALAGIAIDDDVREMLRQEAMTIHTSLSPLPGAAERLWRIADVGGPALLAHLYITETEATSTADLLQLARAGIGGSVQTWSKIDRGVFDVAIEAVVIAEIDGATIAAIRCLGVAGGLVFLLDFIHENPLVIESVEPEIVDLFRSMRVRDSETDG
ncbi:hypothetical protein ACWPKO_24785 (plasmid) [Coraliomargarita sp. W4R53]